MLSEMENGAKQDKFGGLVLTCVMRLGRIPRSPANRCSSLTGNGIYFPFVDEQFLCFRTLHDGIPLHFSPRRLFDEVKSCGVSVNLA